MNDDIISTDYKNALFAVLRSALHGEKLALPQDINADKLLQIAGHQNLFPLVFSCLMQKTDFADTQAYMKYLPEFYAEFSAQVKRTEAFLRLYPEFTDKGIYPIVVKGIVCRELYGDYAESRPSGDEDILIDKKDYASAVEVFKSCGYQSGEEPDKALKTVHEITFYSPDMNGRSILTVEMHLNPFGTESALQNKMNKWFENAFRENEDINVQGTLVRTMTPTNHFLFLIFHAFKHFVTEGLGLRMMIDILLYAEKYSGRIDWAYIDNALTEIGACGFLADLISIGNEYLGFQIPEKYETVSPKDLLDDVFRAGAFGNATGTERTAGRIVTNTVRADRKRENKYTSYMRLLFPSWQTWTEWKPYLSDKPWLLPAEWFKRAVQFLKGETSSNNLSDIDKSYELAENRLLLLKKYGVV